MSADKDVDGRTTSDNELRARNLTTQSADPISFVALDIHVAASAARVVDPDRYEVIGEHGRGGLGRVSRMHDRELGRDVAVKELLRRGSISELRFVREARITARLEHPGIVPVYEAGRWPDGTPFYSMKLVAGRPLRELIAERSSVDERIGLLHHVIAVADAMAYAHGRNIIHRDLKPANVIVGEFGETVVIDWGLAKDLSSGETIGGDGSVRGSDDGLTTAGSVLGTPAYMAPEQERGEVVDRRADVFAIGAMLWELCSMHRVPPTERRQRHRLLRRSGIDHDLAEILDKAIDPDPARRYADAGELAADLKAFKSGARISARSYSLPAVLAHWTRRHRVLALGIAGLLAVLVVSVASLAWLYRASRHNASLARHNEGVAQDRLVRSYVEQGRRALLSDSYRSALPFLNEASHRGDHSNALRFMLDRAAEPVEAERLRLPALAPRAWETSFSRSGERLLTGDDLGARVWDARTGQLLFSMPHADWVVRAVFTPDERRVITVGRDGLVKIWNARDGALERAMRRDGPAIKYGQGDLSPDGSLVAAAVDGTGGVDLWSVETGTLLATLPTGVLTNRQTLEFSHDGRWLATGTENRVQVFEVTTRRLVTKIDTPGLSSLRFDPSGPHLVTGTGLGDVSIWHLPDGARSQRLLQGGEHVCELAFSPDGNLVAAGFLRSSGSEIIWQARTGVVQARLIAHESGNVRLQFDSSSRLLASGGPGGRVTISDVTSGVPILSVDAAPRSISQMAFDPASGRLAGASLDGSIRLWDIKNSYRVGSTSEIADACATDVGLDPHQRYMAVSCGRHGVKIFEASTLRSIAELPAVTEVPGLWRAPLPAVSSDGALAAIARGDHVDVYELSSQRLVRKIRHSSSITAVRFASKGHLLVTGSSDGAVKVYDDDRELLAERLTHVEIDAVAVLPAGRLLVADATPRLSVYQIERGIVLAAFALPARAQGLRVTDDGRRAIVIPVVHHIQPPTIFDLDGRGLVANLTGPTGQVYSAQYVRGDREILGASTDGTARIWDGITGELIQTLYANDGMLLDATLSPDGTMAVTAGGDGSLRFWDLASGTLIWKLRAHSSCISEVQFQDGQVISRGAKGDLAKWNVPAPSISQDWRARFDRLVHCGPLRLDETTGVLVAQPSLCTP